MSVEIDGGAPVTRVRGTTRSRKKGVCMESGLGELVDLGSHDEVALGEAVNLVRPDGNFDFSPGEEDVRMMTLLLGELADAVHKGEGAAKVGELEGFRDVVLFDDAPAVHLLLQSGERLAFERRDAASARDAGLGCESGHSSALLYHSGCSTTQAPFNSAHDRGEWRDEKSQSKSGRKMLKRWSAKS